MIETTKFGCGFRPRLENFQNTAVREKVHNRLSDRHVAVLDRDFQKQSVVNRRRCFVRNGNGERDGFFAGSDSLFRCDSSLGQATQLGLYLSLTTMFPIKFATNVDLVPLFDDRLLDRCLNPWLGHFESNRRCGEQDFALRCVGGSCQDQRP